VLLLYTDGVTESRNGDGELYETDRLEQALRDAVGGSPEEILAAIRADVRAWTGGQPNDDDLTMLAVSVVP
jgi:serine phosphatase RsbU (regulator of sigma subunit)